jgi:hypothetical protein
MTLEDVNRASPCRAHALPFVLVRETDTDRDTETDGVPLERVWVRDTVRDGVPSTTVAAVCVRVTVAVTEAV